MAPSLGLGYAAGDLPEGHYEPEALPQPAAQRMQRNEEPRWSSASLDEIPDIRSAGSFASWGRNANTTGMPDSRSGSGTAPGNGLVSPAPGGDGPRHLGSPGASRSGGASPAIGGMPRSPLATVVSEDAAADDYRVGGGDDGDGAAGTSFNACYAGVAYEESCGVAYGTATAVNVSYEDVDAAAFGSSEGYYHHGGEQGGCEDAAGAAAGTSEANSVPSDPESALALLREQRRQYRAWVGQCAVTTLAALTAADQAYGGYGSSQTHGWDSGLDPDLPPGSIPADVPGMVAAMDAAGCVREYLLLVKAASEATREASRAGATFAALVLPEPEHFDGPDATAAGEAAEAEYVSAAYGVTTAVAAAVAALEQLERPGAGAGGATLLQEMLPDAGTGPGGAGGGEGSGPVALLRRRLRKTGSALCGRLRQVGVLTALTHFQMAVEQRSTFIELLTAQASGEDGEEAEPEGSKPLLWAAQVLAEPVAAKLRAHFHPAAPTGRLDRPAWLYNTVLEFVREYGHALSTLDDLLACLNLKPHYNMPAEFARALQEAVLDLVRTQRIPAMMALRDRDRTAAAAEGEPSAAEAEAEALWLGLMDASAAYDVALLPLLGATGPAAEAEAARAAGLLAAAAAGGASRRRACDTLDPTAAGTADMHSRYVAVSLAAAPQAADEGAAGATEEGEDAGEGSGGGGGAAGPLSRPGGAVAAAGAAGPTPLLAAWAAAEGAAVLRAIEAAAYDDSSLAPAEEAAARALGADAGDDAGSSAAGGSSSLSAPWTRETWPSLLASEACAQLDGLVARSRWLSAAPAAQRAFLDSSAGPALALLRRRLGRLVDGAVARGEVLGEEGLAKVCAALCAAHALHDHLHSLLLTDLAPLVAALGAADAAALDAPPTPASSAVGESIPAGKLGGGGRGGGGFWSGLLEGAGGGGSTAGAASPARQALRDGVMTLAGGGATGGASLASVAAAAAGAGGGGGGATAPVLGEHLRGFSRLHRDGCLKVAREIALGFGRCSVAYRHAIEDNPQFPFTPEGEGEGEAGGDGDGPAASITPSFAPALLFLQTTLARLSRCCDKSTFADVWRGAAVSINRFMFNFIATESRFTRAGARQFAADVAGLASLFVPYSRRGAASASASAASLSAVAAAAAQAAGGQHFRELQAAARLLCASDEDAADIMRRASAAAVAAAQATGATPRKGRPPLAPSAGTPTKSQRANGGGVAQPHARGDPVRGGMSADPVLSSAGLACLSPLQVMNVIEHRI
ncbi:hypothetical protein GPECTOR_51g684 [Gonium pectorale]|uniref:Uncharacterized protein n=1 Tax=Gonium pectorale TaxID=33097 RepID=A0A150G759_GONPE|nr:hypothetical protein GPECTOR_51g684 [Gonium pectorale]|eukprot:KXZ45699.1 hypothetical protein GPECTOR_51g684 [Gonium pectorale]